MAYINSVTYGECGDLILTFDRDSLPTGEWVSHVLKDTVSKLYTGDYLQFIKETADVIPLSISIDDSGWVILMDILSTHMYCLGQALKICRWLNTWHFSTTTVDGFLKIMEGSVDYNSSGDQCFDTRESH